MKKSFGRLPDGQEAFLYEISWGKLKAQISDFGATWVRMYVPDKEGHLEDVVLGYDCAAHYDSKRTYFGATVGRNANRIAKGRFPLGEKQVQIDVNEKGNSLHSGVNCYAFRIWTVEEHTPNSIRFGLDSPDGDQGFPGNAHISVTYTLENPGALHICYHAVSDKDTVFNLTNHTYFNMAGHSRPERAMEQMLMLPARFYTPADEQSIPTGEWKPVEGTPMDFRVPKPVGQDLNVEYPCFRLQGGYDHNFEAYTDPCATLTDPVSGRSVSVTTDLPGIQVYSGNYLNNVPGKDGAVYSYRGGVALETQFYPDSVNHPEWPQPFCKAGEAYHSETVYTFKW